GANEIIEQIIYTAEAEDNVADSYTWYEDREPGLGEDFLRCVEACVLLIQRIHFFILWQPTNFGVRLSGVFLTKYFMKHRRRSLSSMQFFSVHEIHKSGANVSKSQMSD
ncbi:MAG: hypothetical protein ABIQ35_10780, partial [Verrucomicrobiota bacterium]